MDDNSVVIPHYRRARTALAAVLSAIAVIAGLSAATPADADTGLGTPPEVSAGDWSPVGVDADKGAPPPTSTTPRSRAATTTATATTAAACPTGCYFYGLGRQEVTNTGAYATGWIAKPAVDAADHSIGEVSVQSSLNGTTRQIVEVGWSVDPGLFGDEEPHLFVYYWVNGKPACYNGCGFVVAADAAIQPGAKLTPGTLKKFGIQYARGNWWVSYDDVWFGYFPGTLWSEQGVTFTSAGAYQVFGEVASTTEKPCTDMGTGNLATVAGTRAYFSAANYFDESSTVTTSKLFTTTSTTSPTPLDGYYAVYAAGTRAFFYGGPGFC